MKAMIEQLEGNPEMNELEKANYDAIQARKNLNADRLLGLYFPVLDHGFVSLVDYMGSDGSVARAARCSYGAGTRAVSDDRALIRYLVRHRHCYHPSMEVLTSKGWKKWSDCNSEEVYLIPDPKQNKLLPEKLKTKVFDCDEELITFENSRLSFKVTKDHRMWFRPRQCPEKKEKESFGIHRAKDITWGHHQCLPGFKLYDFSFFDIQKDYKYSFLGFFLGDGSFASTNRISFHLKKERKIKYLESLLSNLEIKYSISPSSTHEDGKVYFIETPQFLEELIDVKLRSRDKIFDLNVFNLTAQQAGGLLDGLINSDGHIKKDREQISYHSSSNSLLNCVQLLFSIFGIDCHRASVNSVTAYLKGKATIEARKQHWGSEGYNGKVYCATSSTGLLMVRGGPDKYAFISGNTSPLEQVEIQLHCKMPIFVARQWVRHRTASLNEMSGRYSVMPLQFYSPEFSNFKKQSTTNKQGRDADVNHEHFIENRMRSDTARQLVKENYVIDIQNDVARELARIDLPLSTYTEWYWKMDLHNLMHFLRLRCDGHAQYEIRAFANVIAGIVKEVAPLSYEAWMDYSHMSESFSHQEMKAMNHVMNDMADDGSCQGVDDYLPTEDQYKDWGLPYGLSKREVAEFVSKVRSVREPNDFTLDLSTAKSPQYFHERAKKYVPDV